MIKVLIFGDIYGRIGRSGLQKELPNLQKKYEPDLIIANVDNITSGRGAIEKHLLEMEKFGVDIFTSGDHIFDNFIKVKDYLAKPDSKLLRFENLYDDDFLGSGHKIIEKNGKKILVIHVQGEVYMPHKVHNPFLTVERLLKKYEKGKDYDAVIIDMHKEVSSEGYGMAHLFDGKISFVYGTHTHIQTNDDYILEKGTGILSDVGMNGPINSVIGATFSSVKGRFVSGINKGKIEQSLDKKYLVSGVYVELLDNGLCEKIEKVRIINEL